jgi:ABC-type lipoprotein release transport system permease subunit
MFVQLDPGTSPQKIESQLVQLRNKYREKNTEQNGRKDDTKHHLQQLKDIHFNGDYGAFQERLANKKTLYGLLAVAFFLLLLACINYMNVAVASVSTRLKEIGIRKVIGGGRKELIQQFLIENTVLCSFALAIGTVIAATILLPGFNSLYPIHIPFQFSSSGTMFTFFGGVLLFVALIFFAWLWGVVGALLAVPLLVTAKVICDGVPALTFLSELLAPHESPEPSL